MIDLSIILPIYNSKNYLEKCMNAVLTAYKQTIDFSIEIIVVDDGSTDDSLLVIHEYQKNNNFIKLHSQQNQGVYVARNKGLAVAKGKFIWFIDSDDTITPNSIALIQQKIRNSTVEIIHFPYVQEIYKHKFKTYYLSSYFKAHESIEGVSFLKNNDGRLYLWTNIYKRAFLVQNSLAFTGKVRSLEDSFFNIKTFYFAKRVEFIKEPLYEYRLNSSSISRNHTVKKLEVLKESSYFVHKQLKNFLEQKVVGINNYTIISEKLGHSVLGFFYSLLVQKYHKDAIKKALKDYREMGLYPVKSKEESVKAKTFQGVLNKPKLYLVVCKLYKFIS